MTITPNTATDEQARKRRQYVHWLAEAARARGLTAALVDDDTIELHVPDSSPNSALKVHIGADEDGDLHWYWPWGDAICDAESTDTVIRRLTRYMDVPSERQAPGTTQAPSSTIGNPDDDKWGTCAGGPDCHRGEDS